MLIICFKPVYRLSSLGSVKIPFTPFIINSDVPIERHTTQGVPSVIASKTTNPCDST